MTQSTLATFDVLGVPVAVTTLALAAQEIEAWARDDTGRFVCVRDVPSLMRIAEDPALASIHDEAAMITPDGTPLAIIGKLKGLPVQRTCGADLIAHVCARSARTGLRHYFYGGKPGIAQALVRTFEARHPGIAVVGCETPPFRPLTPEEDEALVARILASGADIVWVGMSSPKQDIWMRDHYTRLPQTLIGVGAAFDFHSGAMERAPEWMRDTGLEWLYRLAREPRRLWYRYLVLAPKFLVRYALRGFGRRQAGRTA